MKIRLFTIAGALVAAMALTLSSCDRDSSIADAYGQFEADEVVVSAQAQGEILKLIIEEGDRLKTNMQVGYIDSSTLHIKRLEIEAGRAGVAAGRQALNSQITVLEQEKINAVREVDRIHRLYDAAAATEKQRDDADGALNVLNSKIASLRAQYAGLASQLEKLNASEEQLKDQIDRCTIINPVEGTVLSKIALEHELTAPGRPLYSIANLDEIELKAYVSGSQLASVVIGNKVDVAIDGPDGTLTHYDAVISWIASEAEFTPKLIQTRRERVDLVYAVKARVVNDGAIKISMPGELYLNPAE